MKIFYFIFYFLLNFIYAESFGRNTTTGDTKIGIISNGKQYDPVKYPYVVSLVIFQPDKKIFGSCTGTLISSLYVLTAAHCTETLKPKNIKVFRSPLSHQKHRKVHRIHQHPNYNTKTLVADISLLELSKPFHYVKRYSILSGHPREYDNGKELLCEIIGFGLTEEETNAGNKGYVTTVRSKFGPKACLPHIGARYNLSWREFLCAKPDTHMICPGDSGGPMICNGYQYGIASHGYDTKFRNSKFVCGGSDIQTVHLFVYNYMDWISATMKLTSVRNAAIKSVMIDRIAFYACFIRVINRAFIDERIV